jgi:hypothetical protein
MNKIGIFVLIPEEKNYKRVGGFSLTEDGAAELEITDKRYESDLLGLAEGVVPRSLKRLVPPAEGEVFLQALAEHFSRSSYWRVADESQEDVLP